MPSIGTGSPMNLTLKMTTTATAASPEGTGKTEVALVIYCNGNPEPPNDGGTWRKVPAFTPDPHATYTLQPDGGPSSPVPAEGVVVYHKDP